MRNGALAGLVVITADVDTCRVCSTVRCSWWTISAVSMSFFEKKGIDDEVVLSLRIAVF